VLKSFVKVLIAVTGLLWAGMACAIGFGSANVSSALGQPLKVEIALKDVAGSNVAGLSAHLASPDAFKAAGLDYPYHLSKLKFEIVTRNDQSFIEITSKEPVNDSFINLLVELTWNSGKLLREYTFLLDPPDYHFQKPKGEPVAPIEPVAAPVQAPEAPSVAPLTPAAAASAPAAIPEVTAGPLAASEPAVTTEEVSTQAASAPAATPSAAEKTEISPESQPGAMSRVSAAKTAHVPETIRVKRGDTLTKIASRVMRPDVTLDQMLIALYRANRRQFDGRNMNRIRAGKILQVPGDDAFEHLSNREAVKEIRVQTANWNAYRQKLAAYGTAVSEQPKQGATGKISTQVVDQTPVKKPGNGGTLQISRGEAPGAGGKVPAGPAAREESIAKQKTVKENEKRIAQLEKQIQDINKVQEKKQSLVNLQGGVQPHSAVAPASSPLGARTAEPAKPQAPVKPRPKIAPAPAPAPEPSMLDSILSPITDSDLAKEYPMLRDPLYLGGGLGVIVLLIGGAVYAVRRRGAGGGARPKKKKKFSLKKS
jgi:pilus assembly protein FimV